MKVKSQECSTGHGTGITPPLSLRTRLERLKHGKSRKRLSRRGGTDRDDGSNFTPKGTKTYTMPAGWIAARARARLHQAVEP